MRFKPATMMIAFELIEKLQKNQLMHYPVMVHYPVMDGMAVWATCKRNIVYNTVLAQVHNSMTD